MKSAGLVRGAYHFFHADVDPTQQATFFLAAVGTLWTAGDAQDRCVTSWLAGATDVADCVAANASSF